MARSVPPVPSLIRSGVSLTQNAAALARAVSSNPALRGQLDTLGQGLGVLGGGLGVASAFTNDSAPTGQRVVQGVGGLASGVNSGLRLAGQAPIPYVSEALQLANAFAAGDDQPGGLGGGLTRAAAGIATGGLSGIPELLHGLTSDSATTLRRRGRRTSDAYGLTNEVAGPFARGLQSGNVLGGLQTPVGGSDVGNALASILNYQGGGGWYADTAIPWLPDAGLDPTRTLLGGLGFPGTTVENGEIVRREPSRGDVGGVTEMVAGGGGFRFLPQDVVEYLGTPASMTVGEGVNQRGAPSPEVQAWWNDAGLGYAPIPADRLVYTDPAVSALGWNTFLRDATEALTGQPITLPSPIVFGDFFDDGTQGRYAPYDTQGEAGVVSQFIPPAGDGGPLGPLLAAMPPDVRQRVLAANEAKRQNVLVRDANLP